MTTPGGDASAGDPAGGARFHKPGAQPVRFDKPGATAPPPEFSGQPVPALEPQAGPTYDLASWGRRAAATLIDAVVLGLLCTIVGAILWALVLSPTWNGFSTDDDRAAEDWVALLWWLLAISGVFLVAALTYAPIWMARTNGRTLGKQMLGIRVVRADGAAMTYGYAVFRELLVKGLLGGIASSFTIYLYALVDVLWPLWDSERRAIHDYVARTRVVRD